MKRIYLSLIMLFAILFFSCFASKYSDNHNVNTIKVNGIATLNVVPDEVHINLGVESFDADVKVARKATQKKINALVKNLTEDGVKKDNIQYDYLRIYPQYPNYEYGKKITGYNASLEIDVMTDDFSKINNVIDIAVESGITKLGNLYFTNSKMTDYKKQVRTMALNAAKSKAEQIANEMKIELGRVVNVEETQEQNNVFGNMQSNVSNVNAFRSQQETSSQEDFPSPGKIPLKLTVECTYQIN